MPATSASTSARVAASSISSPHVTRRRWCGWTRGAKGPRGANVNRTTRTSTPPAVSTRVTASSAPAGLTGWDLGEAPDGVILRLAKALEAEWQQLPNVREAPCAPELKSVDAIAADGDPSTRIRIENLCLQTDVFRKMHLEVAWGLGGMEVLHCVMYPWPDAPLPMFAADLVAFGGRVTLCIADASPAALDLSLPDAYVEAATAARERMLVGNRPWGQTVRSLARVPCGCPCRLLLRFRSETYHPPARRAARQSSDPSGRLPERVSET